MMASRRNGTLYIGVTNDIVKRVYEHKNNLIKGFTEKYRVHHLVYIEETNDIDAAITREKQLKKWKRAWKLRLIEEQNPTWKDLYEELLSIWIPASAGMTTTLSLQLKDERTQIFIPPHFTGMGKGEGSLCFEQFDQPVDLGDTCLFQRHQKFLRGAPANIFSIFLTGIRYATAYFHDART